ncbi:hypothetical protein [Chryseobacterium sp.]|uniref:hypothetical protein n=1 Tax=Chryseobacterium sp. TaxID=1871047 RepID=UPI0011C748EF|nr:hypothetical protein [Chryseobacterium sp.]TXF79595.1 hypothetical protein FUA25_04220 [Chryseobacterium sp.]
MNRILLFLIFVIFQSGFAQNLDFLKIRKFEVSVLSDSLKENSGLHFVRGKLYTFNDGGNSSEIFEIDTKSGKINRTFTTGLQNQDWEAMTSDSANIYIADFGSNAGMRKDLKIYRIPFESLLTASALGNAREITFFYPQQTDFTKRLIDNDYDAEAMIFLNGKIHLFTKEWRSRAVTHYTLDPQMAGNQPAQQLETFQTDFVVTDASYFDKKLYLIGYTKKTEVFLSVFTETQPGIFFQQEPQKYYLGSALSIGQIEGIAVDGSGVYISGEEFRSPLGTARQRLYFVPNRKLH